VRPRRKIKGEDELREEAAINAELVSLSTHPSWPELEREVARKREKIERYLTRKMLSGIEPVNQREVDLLRGVIEGMTWLVARPTSAERSLERYLADRQNVQIGEE